MSCVTQFWKNDALIGVWHFSAAYIYDHLCNAVKIVRDWDVAVAEIYIATLGPV